MLAFFAACGEPVAEDDASWSLGDQDMSTGSVDMTRDMSDSGSVDMNPAVLDMPGDLGVIDLGEDLGEAMDMSEEDMSSEPDMAPPPTDSLAERGPYGAGYTTTEFSYTVQPSGASRSIKVSIWHPTMQADGAKARYLNGILSSDGAIRGASIPAQPETFPLLVFSHGNGSFPEQSYFLTEHFASHGWIVISPEHTNNSVFDNDSANALLRTTDRPQDITAMLDWFEQPDSHPFAARMDTSRVAMTGHSFGGYTTLANAGASFDVAELEASCATGDTPQAYCALLTEPRKPLYEAGFRDARIKAAIPVTPGLGPLYRTGTRTIDVPTLFVSVPRDATLPESTHAAPLWAHMPAGKGHVRLEFVDAGHYTPSNLCELTTFIPAARNDGCSSSFTDPETVQRILAHYTLGFAQHHVLGYPAPEALATGMDRPYEERIARISVK